MKLFNCDECRHILRCSLINYKDKSLTPLKDNIEFTKYIKVIHKIFDNSIERPNIYKVFNIGLYTGYFSKTQNMMPSNDMIKLLAPCIRAYLNTLEKE